MKRIPLLSLLCVSSYMGAAQEHPLISAVCRNDSSAVLSILNGDRDVLHHARGGSDYFKECQPLHWAFRRELAELLIMRGADVNAQDQYGKTPLMSAISCHNKDVAQLLIQHKASINQVDPSGRTALHTAVERASNVKLLVQNKAAVDIADSSGVTPLHQAIKYGRVKATRLFLQHQASVHIPVTLAEESMFGTEEEQKLIMELLEPYRKSQLWVDSYLGAAQKKLDRVIGIRLAPILVRAVNEDNMQKVLNLLNEDVKGFFSSEILGEVLPAGSSIQLLELLIMRGADINVSDVDDETALHAAAFHGRMDYAQLLLQHKALTDLQDWYGDTVLNDAKRRGNLGMVKLLLKHNASADIENRDGKTARTIDFEDGSPEDQAAITQLLRRQESQ